MNLNYHDEESQHSVNVEWESRPEEPDTRLRVSNNQSQISDEESRHSVNVEWESRPDEPERNDTRLRVSDNQSQILMEFSQNKKLCLPKNFVHLFFDP